MQPEPRQSEQIFLELEHKLRATPWQSGASEAHGMLTGLACKGVTPANVRQRADLFQLSESGHIDMIEGLFAMAHRDLENDQPGFDLMLPPADASQLERGEAISSWCQGFIAGLCHEDTQALSAGEETVREALASILEIGHLELDLDDPDGNESALFEIEEFLRVAVQLVYDHLQPAAASEPRSLN